MSKNCVYYPKGVCSKKFELSSDDGIITSVKIEGGCQGNLSGISKLLVGMSVADAISKLEGTKCGTKSTSCPDQLSIALKELL